LLLLFVGIHNAWDTVTFLTLSRLGALDQPEPIADAELRSTDDRTSNRVSSGVHSE
jgi:hypothetical protein